MKQKKIILYVGLAMLCIMPVLGAMLDDGQRAAAEPVSVRPSALR